uniref:F-box domain-containing protein n=1 Tax=Timema poppense TaxID=170557 RepID=A0A7R9DFH3_TIMPO|nr:unnamed protein product [Timema poppensis]
MEFLPLSDRISASQVCQQWYDASRELKLHRREVVILQDDMTQAVKVFHNSPRPVLHLVLKDLELGSKLSAFWDRFCPQLLSLAIQCCDVSERTFFEVLSRCYHLELLQVSGCRELLMSGRVLETPRDVAVLRKTLVKLRELSLDSNRYLSDALFNRFVAIAPNLDCLSLTGCQISFHSGLCRKFYPGDSARLGSVMASESVLTFNNILQLIVRQARKLRKLKFGHTLMDNLALARISEVPGLHLTVVHLQNCDQLNNTGVVALTQRQRGLRELDLSMCTRITDLSLLEVCNNLKSLSVLKLRSCRGISNIGVSQLHRLTSLTDLDLSQCELVTGEGLQDGLCSRTNATLERLRLTALNLDERIVCRLAECLPNLTLLDLGFCFNAVTDRSIQAICRHQVLLRKLILTSCDKASITGLTVSRDIARRAVVKWGDDDYSTKGMDIRLQSL